jgi:predicted ATP-dependent serine protease
MSLKKVSPCKRCGVGTDRASGKCRTCEGVDHARRQAADKAARALHTPGGDAKPDGEDHGRKENTDD